MELPYIYFRIKFVIQYDLYLIGVVYLYSEYAPLSVEATEPQIGYMYLAKPMKSERWERVTLLEIRPDRKKAYARGLDSGNKMKVLLPSGLKKLELERLRAYPYQALHCSIATPNYPHFSHVAIDLFRQLTFGEEVDMEIIDAGQPERNIYAYVKLVNKNIPLPANTDPIYQCVNVVIYSQVPKLPVPILGPRMPVTLMQQQAAYTNQGGHQMMMRADPEGMAHQATARSPEPTSMLHQLTPAVDQKALTQQQQQQQQQQMAAQQMQQQQQQQDFMQAAYMSQYMRSDGMATEAPRTHEEYVKFYEAMHINMMNMGMYPQYGMHGMQYGYPFQPQYMQQQHQQAQQQASAEHESEAITPQPVVEHAPEAALPQPPIESVQDVMHAPNNAPVTLQVGATNCSLQG
jgi:hypothetical protein